MAIVGNSRGYGSYCRSSGMAWSCIDWDIIVFQVMGVTDVSFQHDECLALSVDSTNPAAADCYRIVSERTHFKLERAAKIASGLRGTANLAIAVSQPYYAVALLNREGGNYL